MSIDTAERLKKALSEALAGAGGIILSAYVVYPIDFVKTRMQLPGSPYSSMSNGFRRIIAEEGFLTLYQGVESELLKGSLQNFIYLFAYDLLKAYARDEKMLTVVDDPRSLRVGHTRPLLNRTLHCFCHGSNTSGVRYAYRKEKRKEAGDNGARERRVSVSSDGLRGGGDEEEEAISLDADKETRQIVKVVTSSQLHSPSKQPLKTAPAVAPSASSSDPSSAASSDPSKSPPSPAKAPAQLSIVSNLLIGIVAGCFCQLFINPLSVIQTRLMTQRKAVAGVGAAAAAAAAASSSSILGTALQIWRSEGFSAFYTGLLPAFILTSNPAIQFLVFDRLKSMLEMILQQHQSVRPINAVESFVIGAIAKITATLATYPYIMAKLRLQYKGPLPPGHHPYTGTVDVIVTILKNDGLMGLYAGLRAQLLKSVLGAALMFMMKEQLMLWSDRLLKRKSAS